MKIEVNVHVYVHVDNPVEIQHALKSLSNLTKSTVEETSKVNQAIENSVKGTRNG